MTTKTWIIFGAIIAVLFGGLIYSSSKDSIDVSNVNQDTILAASEQSGNIGDLVYGSKTGKVLFVEYGDYQCPGCASAYEPVKKVMSKYKDQVSFVFRNYPLPSIHPNAKAAAAAAETAGLMGKFWEMHDVIYKKQQDWQGATPAERTDIFVSYAGEIGLDKDAFRKKMTDSAEQINKKIAFDVELGKKAGVSGTPTFFINGKLVDQRIKDGKIAPANAGSNLPMAWGDADILDKEIIQPALKKAGIPLPDEAKK